MKQDAGTGIMYREWGASSPRTILLLVHGLGGHSLRWQALAEFFQRNNISSYAIELRGFGETKSAPGHVDSFAAYLSDILHLRRIIGEEHPGAKIFLVGESMGSVIGLLAATRHPGFVDGLVCMSPSFADRLKFGILDYAKIFLPLLYNPAKPFHLPFTSQMATRDIDRQKALDSDEREHRYASSGLLFEFLMARWRVTAEKKKIAMPVLFLVSGADVISDPGASRKVFDGLGSPDKRFILYPEMYHALSIETGREKVFADMLEWINKRS